MKKAAVIIGVNKTGGLPILSAAVSGAKEFKHWAEEQDFETTLLSDEQEPVTLFGIKEVIKKLVNARTYTQLLVFFAGHGILKGPNDEHWLLSGAPDDPNEAVNVSSSKYLAYNTGIPHIVFISDACRSAPPDPLISSVMGGVIFPNKPVTTPQPDIDMFYATRPGDAAYEVKDPHTASKNYRGLFTTCMLRGLSGREKAIIKTAKEGTNTIPVIFPYELKKYVEVQLPLDAQAVNILLNQDPRIEVTSRDYYLSQVEEIKRGDSLSGIEEVDEAESIELPPVPVGTPPSPPFQGLPKDMINMDFEMKDKQSRIDDPDFDVKGLFFTHTNVSQTPDIDQDIDKFFHARGRESFETTTGFSVIGTSDFEIWVDKGGYDRFRENDYEHIRIHINEKAGTLLLVTASGNGTPIAILPGFIGTIMIENDRVVNVNYAPSRTSNMYDDHTMKNDDLAARRAKAMLAAKHGMFQVSGDIDSIVSLASYLRNQKAIDPTLGLFSAYAYAQAGKTDQVKSVHLHMTRDAQPVLFDIVLLDMLSGQDMTVAQITHAPFCPMLTQGWSYFAIAENSFTPLLKKVQPHLLPGLWTTFAPEGVNILIDAIKTNQLI
jgi:hypothetical protein